MTVRTLTTEIAGNFEARHPETGAPWTLRTVPETYTIANVRVVTGDRVTEEALVSVRDGLIEDVIEAPGLKGTIDGGGLLLTPGFIDVHSDALEKEREPRPSAPLPWDFAIASFESKLVAAGVTTVFHGAGFHHKKSQGIERTPEAALLLCRTVDEHESDRVDHRVLHRFNVRADGADLIRERLSFLPEGHGPILLSHEDHTPGQGQYANMELFVESLVKGGEQREDVERRLEERLREAERTETLRDENLAWAGNLAATGVARLLGHDPDSAQAIDELVARGGSVAEFPTTLEAAERAHELGLAVVAGAPNVLRGGSHSGNIAAEELIGRGLVDALASDYLPSGLLGSLAVLLRKGTIGLPEAIRMLTEGPARVAGFTDRGSMTPGHLADFTLIDDRGYWPHVVTTLKSRARKATTAMIGTAS